MRKGSWPERHKVEAKKEGYRDYMRFIDVHPGAKENLIIQTEKNRINEAHQSHRF